MTDIRLEQEKSERKRIVKWLSTSVPNPSKEHNIAREKHEPTTGSWLIKSNELETWVKGNNSFIWLNGGGR
jgi:hypothetical protein